tara:strand:- start:168 stop:314 length:147 start_codon:yes stop_codon:yes gene_type:complete
MGYAGSIAIIMLIITIVVAQIFLRKNQLLQHIFNFISRYASLGGVKQY